MQARVKVHAIVTSYEVAMMEATELRKLEFEALVVDEGHRLKNSSSRCKRVTGSAMTPRATGISMCRNALLRNACLNWQCVEAA